MKGSQRAIVSAIAAAAAALFVLGPLLVRAVFPGDPSDVDFLAKLGDSYGAVNALFSGGALFVLALVFLHDRRNRAEDLARERKTNSPFVIPTMAIEGSTVQIFEAVHDPSYRLEILLDHWELETSTSSVALNVEVATTLRADGRELGSELRRVDRPISAGSGYVGKQLTVHMTGERASTAMELLSRPSPGRALILDIRIDYGGVDGLRWFTKYSVGLQATSQTDRDQLQRVLDRDAKIGGPGERIVLEATILPDSWTQG